MVHAFTHYDFGIPQRAFFVGIHPVLGLLVLVSADGGGANVKYYRYVVNYLDRLWHCFGFTFDGSLDDVADKRLKLFVGGHRIPHASLVVTTDVNITTIHNSTANLLAGARFNAGVAQDFAQGLVDEIALYSRALTEEQMARAALEYHNLDRDGLQLWARLEEGVGLTAFDRSGGGHHGALLPALTPPTWVKAQKWELRAEAGL